MSSQVIGAIYATSARKIKIFYVLILRLGGKWVGRKCDMWYLTTEELQLTEDTSPESKNSKQLRKNICKCQLSNWGYNYFI